MASSFSSTIVIPSLFSNSCILDFTWSNSLFVDCKSFAAFCASSLAFSDCLRKSSTDVVVALIIPVTTVETTPIAATAPTTAVIAGCAAANPFIEAPKFFIVPLKPRVESAAFFSGKPNFVSVSWRFASSTPLPSKIANLSLFFKPFADNIHFNWLSFNSLLAAPIANKLFVVFWLLNNAIAFINCAVFLAAAAIPVPIATNNFDVPLIVNPASAVFNKLVLSKNSIIPVVACIIPPYNSSLITFVDKDSIAAVNSLHFASSESWYTP